MFLALEGDLLQGSGSSGIGWEFDGIFQDYLGLSVSCEGF